MRDRHLAPLVRIGEDLYDAIEELNVHHPSGLSLGPATLYVAAFVPVADVCASSATCRARELILSDCNTAKLLHMQTVQCFLFVLFC